MYMHEVTYDLNELFRMNYHIHTTLSRCGRQEMTLAAIIKEAERAGLSEIAITDHIHPGETAKVFRNDKILRAQLKNIPHTVKVYLGTELSAYGKNKYTLQYSNFDKVEYRLYSHNHYQMDGWELPDEQTPLSYKQHMKLCLEKIIKSGKNVAISPCGSAKAILAVIAAVPDSEDAFIPDSTLRDTAFPAVKIADNTADVDFLGCGNCDIVHTTADNDSIVV